MFKKLIGYTSNYLSMLYSQSPKRIQKALPLLICVGRDFSRFPHGALRLLDGTVSGEEFRQRLLEPAIKQLSNDQKLVVRLDKVACHYDRAFLLEAFGALKRLNLETESSLKNKIEFFYQDPAFKHYEQIIWTMIKETN